MEYTITIFKFNDLSKRHDIKNPTWLALDNSIFSHPDFFCLPPPCFVIYVWLLCVASKVNNETIRISDDHCAYQTKTTIDDFNLTIQLLDGKRFSVQSSVQIRTLDRTNPYAHVQVTPSHLCTTNSTDTTNERTNKTNERNTATPEMAYASPPRPARRRDRGCVDGLKNLEVDEYLESVTKPLQQTWLNAYPSAEWISVEIKKSQAWIEANPQKKSKDYGRFMTNWLSRAFESYRKGISSRRQTAAELNEQVAKELKEKYARQEREERERDVSDNS